MESKILGGVKGALKCSCGKLRYPGARQCPQCYFGDDFDPIAHAQAEKRAEIYRETGDDPKEQQALVFKAFNFAKWMVGQGYCTWPTAYIRAAKKYRVSESQIRSIGAKRREVKAVLKGRKPRTVKIDLICENCGDAFRDKEGTSMCSWCWESCGR